MILYLTLFLELACKSWKNRLPRSLILFLAWSYVNDPAQSRITFFLSSVCIELTVAQGCMPWPLRWSPWPRRGLQTLHHAAPDLSHSTHLTSALFDTVPFRTCRSAPHWPAFPMIHRAPPPNDGHNPLISAWPDPSSIPFETPPSLRGGRLREPTAPHVSRPELLKEL